MQCPSKLLTPLPCNIGVVVSLLHTAVCMFLPTALKHTGAQFKREVPIPEFQQLNTSLPTYDANDLDPEEHRNSIDAIPDVVAYLPTCEEFLVDVSVRNLLAQRDSTAALWNSGFAAVSGENDELTRYPTTKGSRPLRR